MSKNIGYVIGYFVGWLLIYGLYAFATIAIVIDLINHELPVAPVTLMLSIYVFRKVLQASYALDEFKKEINNIDIHKNIMDKKNADLDKMMERMHKFGGSN
jgi:hypothetical protein